MHFYSAIVAVRAHRDLSCNLEVAHSVGEAGVSESEASEISMMFSRSDIIFEKRWCGCWCRRLRGRVEKSFF